MTAPLLLRLEAALRETNDPAAKAEIVAQMASYKARVGEFADAESLRQQLREHFGGGQYGRVSIRLMALDALLLYYRELSPNARDRMLRANLIASALRIRDLRALTASWLAHIDFNLNRFTEMAKWLAECFDNLEPDDSSSRLRASLVLGDAFQFADMEPEARRWYEQGRRLASEQGDQAAFGAITYNRAALHVTTGRLRQRMDGALSPGALALIDCEVRSAVNYQLSAGLRSLDHLLTTISIGASVLNENWSVAAGAVNALKASGAVAGGTGPMTLLVADEALCVAKTGTRAEALSLLAAAESLPFSACPSDDRALAYWSLARAQETLGNRESQLQFEDLARVSMDEHQMVVGSLRELLGPYRVDPEPQ